MNRNYKIFSYVVLVLIIIGLIYSSLGDPTALIIAIVVFGAIFYFYKFPPKGFQTGRKYIKPKRKTSFKVIHGNKKDGDDEPPRYH